MHVAWLLISCHCSLRLTCNCMLRIFHQIFIAVFMHAITPLFQWLRHPIRPFIKRWYYPSCINQTWLAICSHDSISDNGTYNLGSSLRFTPHKRGRTNHRNWKRHFERNSLPCIVCTPALLLFTVTQELIDRFATNYRSATALSLGGVSNRVGGARL